MIKRPSDSRVTLGARERKRKRDSNYICKYRPKQYCVRWYFLFFTCSRTLCVLIDMVQINDNEILCGLFSSYPIGKSFVQCSKLSLHGFRILPPADPRLGNNLQSRVDATNRVTRREFETNTDLTNTKDTGGKKLVNRTGDN